MESIRADDPMPADPAAVFGRRCVAFIIDFLILAAVGTTSLLASATWEDVADPQTAAQICQRYEDLGNNGCFNMERFVFVLEATSLVSIFLLVLAAALFNMVIIPAATGGSLGKIALGLRVVDESTFEDPGVLRHLLRWIVLVVDAFPWFILVPLTGLIFGLVTEGHRRIGDFAAKTLVVDKRYVGAPTLVPGVDDRASATMPIPGLWDPPAQRSPARLTYTTGVEPSAHDRGAPGEEEAPQAGVDAPAWDDARNTYIQWDYQLEAWMEWSEAEGRWIPISR